MRIVVLGATGNVGTSVVRALADDPQVTSVLGIARRRPDLSMDKTEWAIADMVIDDLVELFRGADAVVHLAWLFQPTHDPIATWSNNIVGSIRVFGAVAEAEVPALIYASSVGAYSPRITDEPVDEDWPTDGWPAAAYGREKAYLERVLDAFERRHPEIRVVRMRPAFIFKRTSAAEQRRLFVGPLLPLPLVKPGRLPALPGPRSLRFQALHASDAAEAYRAAILRPVRGAFNIAADPVVSLTTIARILQTRPLPLPARPVRTALAAAWHLRVVPAAPDLFDMAMRLPIMSVSRASTELGWAPRWTAVDALQEVIKGTYRGAGAPTPPLAPVGGAA